MKEGKDFEKEGMRAEIETKRHDEERREKYDEEEEDRRRQRDLPGITICYR